jgi:hypothetical protein
VGAALLVSLSVLGVSAGGAIAKPMKLKKIHRLSAKGGALLKPAGTGLNTNQSSNWFGYNQGTLEQGGKLFTSIGGEWVVPTAKQHTAGQAEDSASWIGIGGGCVDANCTASDNTLIQTGTEQDVASNGSTSYDAWFELIPAPELVVTNVAIHPGDTVKATISSSVPEVWTITLTDLTDGQGFTETLPYSSSMDTAEWIEETPLEIGTNAGLAALPDLGTVNFDLSTTNGAPAGLKSSEEMQLIDGNGAPLMTPSSPDPDHDGFNDCAWAASCGAPSSS